MFFDQSRPTEVLPTGVHLGCDTLRLIQLRPGEPLNGSRPTRTTIVASHLVATSPAIAAAASGANTHSTTAELIRRCLREGGFVGKNVVAALPPEMIHVRTFRAAAAPGQQLEALVRRRALEGGPFRENESVHVDVMPVGEVRHGRDVRDEFISLAARDADIRAFLEAVGAGVVVRSLQAEPYAIYRCVAGAAVCPRRDATHAVVHVGESNTLVLVGTGPQLRVLRQVGVGAAGLDQAAARKLGVSPAEARRLRRCAPAEGTPPTTAADPVRAAMNDATRRPMEEIAREAAMCIRYHSVSFRGPLPRRVRLLGGDARDTQLRSLLGAAAGLTVDSRDVFNGVAGCARDDDGGWAVALGLALAFAPATAAPSPETEEVGDLARA